MRVRPFLHLAHGIARRHPRATWTPPWAVGFLACIVVANVLTTNYGLVPVGFGLTATAGTYVAGLAFIMRDSLQDVAGREATAVVILWGAALSYLIADPRIAIASGCAFLFSELADLAVYTPLRETGYLRAAVASNVVGTVVDSFLFLWLAGFPILVAMPGQIVGKLWVTAAVVALVGGGRRALFRDPA